MAIAKIFLTQISTFLLFSNIALGDRGQWDCQDNEFFIECGGCEGTCKEPVITNCSTTCKPPRCECQALEGFVRSHDGACIKFDDCGSYVGIEIYGDPTNYKMLPKAPMAAPPPILNNQPSPAEDYPQSENNFQENNKNYDDETEAPIFPAASASDNSSTIPGQKLPVAPASDHSLSPQPYQHQQQPQQPPNYHPAKVSEIDPYEPSISSNQYRRRFRHRY